jgi:hypothetical protein
MALQMFLDERKTVIALKSSSSLSSPRPLPPPFAYALAMRALTGVHQHKVRVAAIFCGGWGGGVMPAGGGGFADDGMRRGCACAAAAPAPTRTQEAVALWMEVESQGSSSCLQPFVISSGENIFGNKIRNL